MNFHRLYTKTNLKKRFMQSKCQKVVLDTKYCLELVKPLCFGPKNSSIAFRLDSKT